MRFNLLEHFWLRVFALFMGIVLWFHVATEKMYTYQVRLPVGEITLKENLSLISDPLDSVEVVVSATGKKLMRQKWRRSGLRINASNFEAGRHAMALSTTNVTLIGGEAAMTLDEVVFPASVDLEIDFSLEKKVPVIPDIDAEADEGFALTGTINPRPTEITVTGPRSLVKDIRSVNTQHKQLRGLRNDIMLVLPLADPADRLIRLDPDSVEVAVEVVPVKTRVFDSIPVVVFNTPPDRAVYTDPATISVELTGSPIEIDQIDPLSIIVSADYRKLAADGYTPIKIECPTKFTIKNASADKVRIGFR